MIFLVNRYAFSVRKQIQSPKKIYFIDTALAECVGFRFSEDRGRTLENVVFLQLKRLYPHKEIYYHQENKECDFVICHGLHVEEAIQVCVNLQDPTTKAREIAGLVEVMQQYQLKNGLIITEDESGKEVVSVGNKKFRIRIMPAWQWLL